MQDHSSTPRPLGKTKRFEIFKRDGFTCQYCGNRPPDVILEVDHVHPVSKGGSSDVLNLVTSCFDCNRGKRDKVLGEVIPRPDADLLYLETQQEIAETGRYLRAKELRDEAINEVVQALTELWQEEMDTGPHAPHDHIIKGWLQMYGAEEVDEAIRKTGPKTKGGYISDNIHDAIRYVSATLRNRRRDE